MKKQIAKSEPVVDFLNEQLKREKHPWAIYSTPKATKAKAATA
jgi:hypothetical protein